MKLLKRIFLCCTLLTILNGHAGELGGIGSGGGSFLPSEPVDLKKVTYLVRISRLLVFGYLQARETQYYLAIREGKPVSAADIKLFAGKKSILDTISNVKIELRTDKPCVDKAGNEMDGSAIDPTGESICISALRVIEKCNLNSAEYSVPGLIIHELSHLAGTDELEATELQKDYIRHNFAKLHSKYWPTMPLAEQTGAAWDAMEAIHILQNRLSDGQNISCREVEFYYSEVIDVKSALNMWRDDLSWVNAKITDQFGEAHIKFRALKYFLCAQDKNLPQDKRNEYQANYEKGFGSATVVSARDYADLAFDKGLWDGLGLSKENIKKCSDMSCVKEELNEVWSIVNKAFNYSGGLQGALFELK